MLPKTQRISKDAFNEILTKGRVYHTSCLLVRMLPSPKAGKSSFAIAIAKKVSKSAVLRNKTRRRIYSVIRVLLPRFSKHAQSVISVKAPFPTLSIAEQRAEIEALFRKTGLL